MIDLLTYWHDEFLSVDFPKDPLLSGDLLDRGEKLALIGESEAGKSYLVMQLALELATKGSWLGFDVMRRCRVEIFQSENSVERYQQRYRKLASNYEGDVAIEVGVTTTEELKLDTEAGVEAFYDHVLDTGPDVVMFDPSRGFFRGDENDSQAVERWFSGIAKAQTKVPFTPVYVHHIRKGQVGIDRERGTKWMARGSGLFTDRPSTVCVLDMNDQQTEWTLFFVKTRNRERHPDDLNLKPNFKTGLFEINHVVEGSTRWQMEQVVEALQEGQRMQSDVVAELSNEVGVSKRVVYEWVDQANRARLIDKKRKVGPGSPFVLSLVGERD